MLVQIPKVLSVEQVSFVREKLDAAGEAWVDGRDMFKSDGQQL